MKTLLSLLLLFTFSFSEEKPLQSVASVELQKYMGKWYEIARYENWFEKGCVGATAEYILDEEKVLVINRCYNEEGQNTDEANGKAYTVEGSENTRLRVTFFWPFYGNYWIITLAEDYRYVIVGEPSRKYLWILARTKYLSENDKNDIVEALKNHGYNASKLYWTQNDKIVF